MKLPLLLVLAIFLALNIFFVILGLQGQNDVWLLNLVSGIFVFFVGINLAVSRD